MTRDFLFSMRYFKPKNKKRTEGRRQKWNRPTIKMLLKELSKTKDSKQRESIQKKIDGIRAWSKSNPETVTYYPNRTKFG